MKSTSTILSTGLKVANFNSPHNFTFEDGSILKGVSHEFSKSTSLDSEDIEKKGEKFTSVTKKFVMTEVAMLELVTVCKTDADVVIVPLPVLLTLKDELVMRKCEAFQELKVSEFKLIMSKVATCILTDRINKLCSATKFGQ